MVTGYVRETSEQAHTGEKRRHDEIPYEQVDTIEIKGFYYPTQTYRVLLSDERVASMDKV